jgi:hypothetical protein
MDPNLNKVKSQKKNKPIKKKQPLKSKRSIKNPKVFFCKYCLGKPKEFTNSAALGGHVSKSHPG